MAGLRSWHWFSRLWSSNQCQFNAFAALLVDVSDEDNRSKLVGIVWSMLMVESLSAIISSSLLKQINLTHR